MLNRMQNARACWTALAAARPKTAAIHNGYIDLLEILDKPRHKQHRHIFSQAKRSAPVNQVSLAKKALGFNLFRVKFPAACGVALNG